MRNLSFASAIREATDQAMELSNEVIVLGQLVDYSTGVFGTTTNLSEKFGNDRVSDFPVAESLMTSAALGMTIDGRRVILAHHRLDFMMYSMDAITNWISLWRFKTGTNVSVPIVIRAVVGKGWGQGPQHSKSLHAWFSHLPGIRVAVPTNAYDAKGILLESIFSEVPTIIIEHRSLFNLESIVPKKPYRKKFGKAEIRCKGEDITLVSIGYTVYDALKAAERLKDNKISLEVIDPITLSPLDIETINKSASKTGRLVVLDHGWESYGAASEIISRVSENCHKYLKSAPIKITFPDSHTPMSSKLEKEYYPDTEFIIDKIKEFYV